MKWSCFRKRVKKQKKNTKNLSFSISIYAIKSNEICPPGSPREPPEPPRIFTGTTKVKWNGHVSGSVWKDIKNITKNMTCSIGNYAFKTNEISTIWCHRRAPQAKFQILGLSVAVQWIALFHLFSFISAHKSQLKEPASIDSTSLLCCDRKNGFRELQLSPQQSFP